MFARIIAVLACIALAPVAYSPTLRFFYQQWIATQLAKVRRPGLAVAGDSISLAGTNYGSIDTINLGSNGATTRQAIGNFELAKSFRPRVIMVLAGTNDAYFEAPNLPAIRAAWSEMCADPRTVAVLPPPTRVTGLNARLSAIRPVIRGQCKRTIDLSELAGQDGLLRPEYSVDGVHLRPAAYSIWRARLREALR